jgi:hypothetical protein
LLNANLTCEYATQGRIVISTLPIALLVGFAALAAAAAGAGLALGWAMLRAEKQPRENLATAIARLEAERAKDRLDMAAYIEEAAGIGESIKRHRARIDGAEGARVKKEAREAEPPAPAATPEQQRELIKARARAAGRL